MQGCSRYGDLGNYHGEWNRKTGNVTFSVVCNLRASQLLFEGSNVNVLSICNGDVPCTVYGHLVVIWALPGFFLPVLFLFEKPNLMKNRLNDTHRFYIGIVVGIL